MNALEQYNFVANNKYIDIQEGSQWIDTHSTPSKIVGEHIEFTYHYKQLSAFGDYKYYNNELSFLMVYQFEGSPIDLEHSFEGGKETISYDETSFIVRTSSDEQKIRQITVIDKKSSKTLFKLKTNNEFRFLTLED